MYSIRTPAVYVHERVMQDARSVRRMERLMKCIETERSPEVVSDEELNRISGELNWCGEMSGKRTGQLGRTGDPTIIFNRFRWIDDQDMARLKETYPNLRGYYFLGDGAFTFTNGKQLFPHEARARVYRFFIERIKELSPTTRIALCGETPDMWDELRSELGMDPGDYVCACGPTSVPGNPLFSG